MRPTHLVADANMASEHPRGGRTLCVRGLSAPQIWHFACGKLIPSLAKLWIYVPVNPNTHTHSYLPWLCARKSH